MSWQCIARVRRSSYIRSFGLSYSPNRFGTDGSTNTIVPLSVTLKLSGWRS